MKILLRVDSSSTIGTGHLSRCLTLATSLRARGADCLFICRNLKGNSIQRLAWSNFPVKTLLIDGPYNAQNSDELQIAHAAWLGVDWKVDAEQTILAMEKAFFDWIIVDHYALDALWESTMKSYCHKLMVIDDLANRDHTCDVLLDQNLVANMEIRYDGRIPEQCARLLGPDYALLQPDYAELRPYLLPRTGQIHHILVFFGGADSQNCTGQTIRAFLSLNRADISLDVVLSPGHGHMHEICQSAREHANITIHHALPSLAGLMAKADLAIGAAGVSSWERCCLGLPALVLTLAENQKPIARELDRLGVVRWLGHHDQVDEMSMKNALLDCLRHDDLQAWSERCLAVVDGKGCQRVSSIIMLDSQTKIEARLARAADEGLILRWANDPLVRKNAFNPEIIPAARHHIWFTQRMGALEHCRIYIMETNEGIPIGQVRFEKNNEEWEIHYSLDQYARFRGLGFQVLNTAIDAFKKNHRHARLIGRVKAENISSRKIFLKSGFNETKTDTFIQFSLKLNS